MTSPECPVELRFALPMTAAELNARMDEALRAAAEKVARERMVNERVISLAQATAMTPWTESGFKRVATKENLPFVKGPHKSPPGYPLGEVIKMLERLRVWPKGRPPEIFDFPQTPKSSAA